MRIYHELTGPIRNPRLTAWTHNSMACIDRLKQFGALSYMIPCIGWIHKYSKPASAKLRHEA